MTKNKLEAFIYHSAMGNYLTLLDVLWFQSHMSLSTLGLFRNKIAGAIVSEHCCLMYLSFDLVDVASLSGAVVLQQEQPDLEKRAAGHSEGS